MMLRPMMNGVVLWRGQTGYPASQTSAELRIGCKEIERSGLDGARTTHPSGRMERLGVLDLTAELTLKE